MITKKLIDVRFFFKLILITAFLTVAIFQIGCNSNPSDQGRAKIPGDWVDLNVKFKPQTTKEIRELAILSIEKYLIDTINVMRNSGYPGYRPIIVISKFPFDDTLWCKFRVGYDFDLPAPALPLKDTTIKPPPCQCINNCGVCSMVTRLYPFLPSPSQLGVYVDSVFIKN